MDEENLNLRDGLFMLPLKPDNFIVRISASFWILVYGLVYYVFPEEIPEIYLRDAEQMQYLIQGSGGFEPDDYLAGTLAVFKILPQEVNHVIVGLQNCYILWLILTQIKTFRGMVLIIPLLAPLVLLDMMAPTKDTIVLMMTLLIYSVSLRVRTPLPLLLTILGCYAFYGFFVRSYYLLIVVVFMVYLIIDKTHAYLVFLYVLLLLLIVFLLPEQLYQTLEGSRDEVNYWIIRGEAGHEVRTLLTNPFPPDSGLHFLGNYAYALCFLNFPFLLDVSVKEVIMAVDIAVNTWLITTGIRMLQGPQKLLTFLFVAHVTVLILFEPDFGSYMRHFSSVFLYLLPAFAFQERKHAEALRHTILAQRSSF
jgi:hypothetical protein